MDWKWRDALLEAAWRKKFVARWRGRHRICCGGRLLGGRPDRLCG